MTPEALAAAVKSLMSDVSTMTIATCDAQAPRATDVYFAAEKFDLIFFSSPDSEHSRNLAGNPRCSATIHPVVSEWKEIKGIRADGICMRAGDPAFIARAKASYLVKFPFAARLLTDLPEVAGPADKIALYVLRVEELTYIDNTLGFGTKLRVRIHEGEIIGIPQKA